MTRSKKPKPMETFEANIADAESLLSYSRALGNQRTRRMRKELRERVGEALRVSKKEQSELDCIESDDLFVVIRPGSSLTRSDFEDRRPLLRQAIVAGCAALETYIADKATERISDLLRSEEPPRRIKDVSLTVGHWLEIEARYERRGWGIRSIVEEHIRETCSTAPNKIGEVLSTVGVAKWASKIDKARKVPAGTTVEELDEISKRRNRIAHSADRVGQGRASLDADQVGDYLRILREVARAVDKVIDQAAG